MQPHRDPDSPPARPAQPYLDWAIATRFIYLRPGAWLPLLVQFGPGISRPSFARLEWLSQDLRSAVRIPDLFADKYPAVLSSAPWVGVAVLLLDRSKAAAVARSASWNKAIVRCELGPPVDIPHASSASSLPISTSSPQTPSPPCQSAGRFVVAAIDNGIAFAHPRFASPAGTRIAYLWQQDYMKGFTSLGNSPGNELSATAIDAAVQAAKARGSAEEMVYRDIGQLKFALRGYKPLARRRTHGTHVLDLAAGEDPATADSSRPIIAVDMPDAAIADPAGSTLTAHAEWGLMYILAAAEAMRRPGETLPIVVNISYGPHEGPHDGSSILETSIDSMVKLTSTSCTPMTVVLPAGNFRQARIHASFPLAPTQSKTLTWRLQPSGLTPSFMEIWLPALPGAQVQVTLRSPLGDSVTASPTQLSDVLPSSGPPAMAAYYVPSTSASLRTCIQLSIAPTGRDPEIGGHPVSPSGLWTLEVDNLSGQALDIDAWIKRSDTPGGRRAKGRQSHFDDPAYQRYDASGRPIEFDPPAGTSPVSYVKRCGTLSGIATGAESYVIGAYRRGPDPTAQMPSPYSSQGPVGVSSTRASTINDPNCLAPSDDSRACPGVLAAGTRAGCRVAMNGSSAAAPQVARELAAGRFPPTVPGYRPVSNDVPPSDRPTVAGDGLLPSNPPVGRVWKSRV